MSNPPTAPPPAAGSAATAEGQGDDLLNRARELEAEQTALLDTVAVDTRYTAALAVQVEAKHDQVERLEDRLETLIEQQEARWRETQANPPGLLAWPGTRAKWDRQRQGQQATLQRLHDRLENVRERKNGANSWRPSAGTRR